MQKPRPALKHVLAAVDVGVGNRDIGVVTDLVTHREVERHRLVAVGFGIRRRTLGKRDDVRVVRIHIGSRRQIGRHVLGLGHLTRHSIQNSTLHKT